MTLLTHFRFNRLYDVSLVSYVLAWAHFVSEFAFYRTAGFGGVLPSFVVACEFVTSAARRMTLITHDAASDESLLDVHAARMVFGLIE